MGWPHTHTSIQTDNYMTEGVVNDTIVARKTVSMDLLLNWLRCLEVQQQFRFYWAPGSKNWADYSTKHHPPIYHEPERPLFAGASQILYQAFLAHC